MKVRSTNRIYLPFELVERKNVVLEGDLLHYIKNVLRLKKNDKLRIFNEHSGEFLANIIDSSKKEIFLCVEKILRVSVASRKLSVALCIIKNDRMSEMISMLVQLGVTDIFPIISEYTVHHNFNHDRFMRIVKESVEQSERLDVPFINPVMVLEDFLSYSSDKIIYAYENSELNQKLTLDNVENTTYMIGPEGGFSSKDLVMLEKAGAIAVSLGSNILRAETAAVKLVSNIQFLRNI